MPVVYDVEGGMVGGLSWEGCRQEGGHSFGFLRTGRVPLYWPGSFTPLASEGTDTEIEYTSPGRDPLRDRGSRLRGEFLVSNLPDWTEGSICSD